MQVEGALEAFAEKVNEVLTDLKSRFAPAERELNAAFNISTTGSIFSPSKAISCKDLFDHIYEECNRETDQLLTELESFGPGDKAEAIQDEIEKQCIRWQRQKRSVEHAYKKFKDANIDISSELSTLATKSKMPSKRSLASMHTSASTQPKVMKIEPEQITRPADFGLQQQYTFAETDFIKEDLELNEPHAGTEVLKAKVCVDSTFHQSGSEYDITAVRRHSATYEDGRHTPHELSCGSDVNNTFDPQRPPTTVGQSFVTVDEAVSTSLTVVTSNKSTIELTSAIPSLMGYTYTNKQPICSISPPIQNDPASDTVYTNIGDIPLALTNNVTPGLTIQTHVVTPYNVLQGNGVPFLPRTTHPSAHSHIDIPTLTDASGDSPYNVNGSMERDSQLQKVRIRKFLGNPLDYTRYITEFDSYFENPRTRPSVKLGYLIKFCSGDAKNSIERCGMNTSDETAYQSARQILFENYGRPIYVIGACVKELTSGNLVDTDNLASLTKISDRLQSASKILERGNALAQVDAPFVLQSILKRFPYKFLTNYLSNCESLLLEGKEPTFLHFVKFVKDKVAVAKTPFAKFIDGLRPKSVYDTGMNKISVRRKPAHDARKPKTHLRQKLALDARKHNMKLDPVPASATREKNYEDEAETMPSWECLLCYERHTLYRCEEFRKMSLANRNNFVRTNYLCLNCLKPDHDTGSCPSYRRCKNQDCQMAHHTLLHGSNTSTKVTRSNSWKHTNWRRTRTVEVHTPPPYY